MSDETTPTVPENPPAFPKQIQCWETSDGQLFRNDVTAAYHEEALTNAAAANAALEAGKSVAECLREGRYRGTIPPVLETITKDTKLIIEYLQCREEPGYKPIRFEPGFNKVYVYGYAGSWSGSYGSHVGIPDLARYAEATEKRMAALRAAGRKEAGK